MSYSRANLAIAAATIIAAAACDGRLSPDPAAVDAEGLPIAAALPETSGSCEMGHPPLRVVSTAGWDAGTRTFTIGNLYWKLDERGRTVEYGQSDGQWRRLYTRDEHGVTTSSTSEWQGGVTAENSWDQRNDFDADGRLTASELVYRSGFQRTVNEYRYADGLLVHVAIMNEYQGTVSDSWADLIWAAGRLAARESGSGSTTYSRGTRFYDASGRLTRIDIDGAGLGPRIDGTPDLRRSWSYDGAGFVATYVEDGTDALDAPVVDGVPDGTTTFGPACARIAVLPSELYSFQSWLRPY